MGRDPYCRNCGYSLRGLTESSKCPECGKPIVEVLERQRGIPRGKRYRSAIVLFGLPLVHVAVGADDDEPYGKARGIIAIGDTALGWLAIGGRAIGIIAIGGLAIGVFALGGLGIGILALGGGAIGGAVLGGGAVGVVANGGGAVGLVADAGGAVGYYARGGQVYAAHGIDWRGKDPQAVAFFDHWTWLLGARPRPAAGAIGWLRFMFPLWLIAAGMAIANLCALVVLVELRRTRRRR
ncbi:MAG TPA: hypothetical protein PKK06_13415 [Phycisphaerae bacterium]|nr:hypothetical protein [Phycisphaerae bacterium]HNU46084.1 hypothetical protein [Phycisphaerae bacterium]